LHHLSASFVLGYHGCDRKVGERLLAGEKFVRSENDYDWLGSGIYFWEANPRRGLEFAYILQRYRRRHGLPDQINEPFVVGAAIDLGLCLDLTTSTGIQAVGDAYQDFLELCEQADIEPPDNEAGDDHVFRRLDCAVINHLHSIREKGSLPPFDVVKGVFTEGERLYPNSGFREKTHIQICVRNPQCIKGVFRVPED
jgi:hypothetical protein